MFTTLKPSYSQSLNVKAHSMSSPKNVTKTSFLPLHNSITTQSEYGYHTFFDQEGLLYTHAVPDG